MGWQTVVSYLWYALAIYLVTFVIVAIVTVERTHRGAIWKILRHLFRR